MVYNCRVLLPLLAVTLLCTAVRWKDLLLLGQVDVNNEKQEVIHLALGATLSVMPGMVATMRSVLLNTHSQGAFLSSPHHARSHTRQGSNTPL